MKVLPSRMRSRKRRKGDKIYYYFDTGQTPHREIALGSDFDKAIERYEILTKYEQVIRYQIPKNVHKQLHKNTKARAIFKNIECTISSDDILDMLESNDYKCHVSGIPFNANKYKDKRIRPWYPSIDRIDHTRGYTPDNVRLVCASVNIAINQLGDELFFKMISRIKR